GAAAAARRSGAAAVIPGIGGGRGGLAGVGAGRSGKRQSGDAERQACDMAEGAAARKIVKQGHDKLPILTRRFAGRAPPVRAELSYTANTVGALMRLANFVAGWNPEGSAALAPQPPLRIPLPDHLLGAAGLAVTAHHRAAV